ncbi:MAG: hypothetical protein OEZ06_28065 [Myxococcales bacterium]|nr:hypothetical protein [Myxococcales bacterium]
MRLRLSLHPKPFPYTESGEPDPGDWGAIHLQLCDENGENVRDILRQEWHLTGIARWFRLHAEALLSEPPHPSLVGESIADAIGRFYSDDTEPEEQEFDAVLQYRQRHGLRFAMRGTDIPDVYIGFWNGRLEVSGSAGPGLWSEPIDGLDNVLAVCERVVSENSIARSEP